MGGETLIKDLEYGREYELRVRHIKAPEPEPAPPAIPGGAARPDARGRYGHVRGSAFRAATRIVEEDMPDPTAGTWNKAISTRLETGPTPTEAEIREVRRLVLASIETGGIPPSYAYSGRPMTGGTCVPVQADDDLAGMVLQMGWRHPTSGYARQWPLIANTPQVLRMRSPEEQAASIDAIEPLVADATAITAARLANEGLQREKFEGYTHLQRDATLRFNLNPGRWQPEISCPYHVQPWKTRYGDVDYLVTTTPHPYGTPVDFAVTCGQRWSGEVKVFLAPQRHEIRFAWVTEYLFFSWISAFPVVFAQQGVYANQLPLNPPYVFTAQGNMGANDVAMAREIELSARYALALLQDNVTQYFTPYSGLLLVGRVDGRWSVRKGDLDAGDLCAAIDYRNIRYYVWRRTTEPRAAELFDWGPLGISGYVSPYGLGPSFSISPPTLTPP